MREQFHNGEPLWGSRETIYSHRLKSKLSSDSKQTQSPQQLSEPSMESVEQHLSLENEEIIDKELILLWNFYANVYGV